MKSILFYLIQKDELFLKGIGIPFFIKTDTKLFVLVVTLSTQDNSELLKKLKLGFERTFNWNKYQSKVSMETRNQYFNYLIDPSFQGVNRLFVVLFENNADKAGDTE